MGTGSGSKGVGTDGPGDERGNDPAEGECATLDGADDTDDRRDPNK